MEKGKNILQQASGNKYDIYLKLQEDIFNLKQNNYSSNDALDMKLLYVAITRAKKELCIT